MPTNPYIWIYTSYRHYSISYGVFFFFSLIHLIKNKEITKLSIVTQSHIYNHFFVKEMDTSVFSKWRTREVETQIDSDRESDQESISHNKILNIFPYRSFL